MAVATWKYAQNQFHRVTANSRTRMIVISNDHLARLSLQLGSPANPSLQACLDRVQPLFDDFQFKYMTLEVATGTRKGQTEALSDLFDQLMHQRVPQWEATVTLVYPPGSPEFIQIFPKGRAAFNSGKKDLRIQAVKTLALRLASFPEFSALKDSVETFHATMIAIRNAQQGSEGNVSIASDEVESARVALAIGLYTNVAQLMMLHAAEPWKIEGYFELALLRRGGGGSATPEAVPALVTVTFQINYTQSGPTTITFWLRIPDDGSIDPTDVVEVRLTEGEQTMTTAVSLPPGGSQQVVWEGVTLTGELDEAVLLDDEGNVLATGVFDETLPDPGP